MKCCGRSNYNDYAYQGKFPPSCCDDTNNCRQETVYKRGCKTTFVDFWDRNSDIIKYSGLVIAAIEVSFQVYHLSQYLPLEAVIPWDTIFSAASKTINYSDRHTSLNINTQHISFKNEILLMLMITGLNIKLIFNLKHGIYCA